MKAAERQHIAKVVAQGCIACRILGYQDTPSEVHHIRAGMGSGQRNTNYNVLPLCHKHHRTGGHGVAFHAGKKAFEKKFGTELELLERVNGDITA
jgi:hypothetical protein